MFGTNPFSVKNGELCLELTPLIMDYLLDDNLSIRAKFLGHTDVIYHVPEKKNFYPGNYRIYKMQLTDHEGGTVCRKGNILEGQTAAEVRDGKVERIEVWLEECNA